MICYQDDRREDPTVQHARLAALECLAVEHTLFCYSSASVLEQRLAMGLEELAAARAAGVDVPAKLTRIVLVFTDPRAVAVVDRFMEPGFEAIAWPQPDAWLALYGRIEELRARARRFDPTFAPRVGALALRSS
jgi:hypothetical protein